MWNMRQRSAEAVWAGQLIRGARARHGFDHRWAADMLGVTPAYLLMVEMATVPPSVSFCKRVIGTLNMPKDEADELLAAAGMVAEEAKRWATV